MTGKRGIRWLYGELPALVESGVLPASAAQALREHYGEAPRRDPRALALYVLGVFGSALVGLGIILILASNWETLSRGLRAVIAFTPLLASQALTLYAVARRPTPALLEQTAIFQALAVAAAVSLIGQTYQVPGSLEGFLMTWMILIVALPYATGSALTAIVYCVGITAWAGYAQAGPGHAALFWPFAAAIAPFVWWQRRRRGDSTRTTFLFWTVALCAVVATGIVLEKNLPGLWILIYTGLFALLHLGGRHIEPDTWSAWRRPFFVVGSLGGAVLGLVLSFEWPWERIAWRYYRAGDAYVEWASYLDYALLVAVTTGIAVLLATSVRVRKADCIPFGSLPILAIVAYGIVAFTDAAFAAMLLFNLYILALSLWILAMGLREDDPIRLNGGALLLSALIVLRFFDTDLGFAARGAVFIAVGLLFLAVNIGLVRRRRRPA